MAKWQARCRWASIPALRSQGAPSRFRFLTRIFGSRFPGTLVIPSSFLSPDRGPIRLPGLFFWGGVFLIWYVSDSLSLLAGEVESVAGFAVVGALRRDFSCCWLIESGLCLEAVERGDSGVFVGEPSFSGFLAVSPLGYFVFGHVDLLDVFVCCSIICFALGASAAFRSPGCCLFLQVTGPRLLF